MERKDTTQMTLTEARAQIGRDVVYRPRSGGGEQRGVITSVDDVFVYVRYVSDTRSKGTDPGQLNPVAPGGRRW